MSRVSKVLSKINGYEEIFGQNFSEKNEIPRKMTGPTNLQLDTTESLSNGVQNTTSSPQRSKNFLLRFLENPFDSISPVIITNLTSIILVFTSLGLLYCVLNEDAIPGGSAFNIFLLIIVAKIFGNAIEYFQLPALLGMLIAGIFLKNVGLFTVTGVYSEIVILLREVALTTILIKAGLGLDAAALLRLSFVVIRLALCPCLAETISAAAASHFILGFPWLWGLLLGSILSAVSPAVVVPTLLHLKDNGYGNDKSISTLVIAASSVDDIAAISIFGVLLGCIFSEGDITRKVVQGPIEVIIGLLWGMIWGVLAACFPNKNDKNVVFKRSLLLGSVCLLAVLGSPLIELPGAGALGCITTAFIAGVCWKLQGLPTDSNPVSNVFANIWQVIQITLFGLIGTEIDLHKLDGNVIFYGLLVLLTGLVCRILACVISLIGSKLNMKEVIFVNLAWLPKATVQAALAPVALNLVHKLQMENTPEEHYATSILTIAVLSILITAPLGSIGITWGGIRLLHKSDSTLPPLR